MKPETIVKNIQTDIHLSQLFGDLGGEHHSLYEDIAESIMQALGSGTDFYYVGNDEGLIYFETLAVSTGWYTSLVSGADGTTTYMQVTATYTAPEATTITNLILYGTKDTYDSGITFSQETGVNQALEESQDYRINWTIHADI